MAELQEILGKGQSQISTHLAQLKQAGLVDDRRDRQERFLPADGTAGVDGICCERRRRKCRRRQHDREALRLALRKRQDKMRRYFDELARASSAANTCRDVRGRGLPRRC